MFDPLDCKKSKEKQQTVDHKAKMTLKKFIFVLLLLISIELLITTAKGN